MKQLKSIKHAGKSRRSKAGFSLIELLIVVAVILVIAAIAIPNYLKSKMRANEASAVQNLRNITTAQLVYSTTYGINFSPDLAKLSGDGITPTQDQAGLIDQVLASGTKSGYTFVLTVLTTDPAGHPSTYSLAADPQSPGSTGTRHFYTEQSGVIRFSDSAPAGPSDPAIN